MAEEKTPWNPSKSAIKRVKHPFPIPETCPYCGSEVVVETHEQHYGKNYGEWNWLYVCRTCKASVGMHPFTDIPLGTLANQELRLLRKRAKEKVLKKYRNIDRNTINKKLSLELCLRIEDTHFGMFDVDTCQRILEIYK